VGSDRGGDRRGLSSKETCGAELVQRASVVPVPLAAEVWTAVLMLKTEAGGAILVNEKATCWLVEFFHMRRFVVSTERPNLLVVSGRRKALIGALALLNSRPPRALAFQIQDTILCAGAWAPPRERSH
jgi:hypothetical protein